MSLAATFSGYIADELPSFDDVRIVFLQLDYALVSTRLKRLVVVEPLLGFLVERLQVAYGWRFLRVVGKLVFQMSDQHAELGAPIACVREKNSLDVKFAQKHINTSESA